VAGPGRPLVLRSGGPRGRAPGHDHGAGGSPGLAGPAALLLVLAILALLAGDRLSAIESAFYDFLQRQQTTAASDRVLIVETSESAGDLWSSERFRQIQGDAFETLDRLYEEGRTFDLVVLDPPAFAQSKKDKPNALKAYRRLVQFGARVAAGNGTLFAASCSAPVGAGEFYRAVELGLGAAGRQALSTRKTGHALDHPVTFPEGTYLKGIFCELGN